jgi:hypothetical protein
VTTQELNQLHPLPAILAALGVLGHPREPIRLVEPPHQLRPRRDLLDLLLWFLRTAEEEFTELLRWLLYL